MAIENTAIMNEVRKITSSGSFGAYFSVTCQIMVAGKTIIPFRVIDLDEERDYKKNYTDVTFITVLIPDGQYRSLILPNESDILIEVRQAPIGETGVEPIRELNNVVRTYKATLLQKPSSSVKGATPDNIDILGADLSQLTTVQFRLVDLTIDKLRTRTTGGIFQKYNNGLFIQMLLGKETKKAGTCIGVDLYKPNNATINPHIVIPDGTPVVDLPGYVQVHCGGVYSAGMAWYYQNAMWYIYPQFDTTRFTKEKRTLTVINIPPNKMPSIERTFRTTAYQVIILSTGELMHVDNSESLQLNHGNGTRFTDGNKITDGYGIFVNGKYLVSRKSNNSEIYSHERPTGINRAMVSNSRITANPFNEYSKLAQRKCSYVQLVWENSSKDLLYPGMPVKLIYENNAQVAEIEGVLCHAHHFTTGQGSSMINARHVTHSVLTLMVEKN